MARNLPAHVVKLLFLTAFAFAIYAEMFAYDTFFPEFPLFFFYSGGIDFHQVLRSYTYTTLMWYRPTSFALTYWIGERFAGSWHNLNGWKLFHFWTVLPACYAIYWFAVRCLHGSRTAALLAVTYFIAQPSLCAVIMEIAPFDFVYILLVVLSAGLYLAGSRMAGIRSMLATAASWVLFVVAITSKELALATPMWLASASAVVILFEYKRGERRRMVLREAIRVAPFFAVLPAYYFFHLTKVPPGSFGDSGLYRLGPNWVVILANLKKFLLWILRIYGFTGSVQGVRMYQSTPLNNAVGIAAVTLVLWQWRRHARSHRTALALMLAWMAIFLAIPTYAGGFIWHVNLPLVGYSLLFGMAGAWALELAPRCAWRWAALSLFYLGALLLARENLRMELYHGAFATVFRLDHSVIRHPPVPAAQLGKAPLVYVEDRLHMGPWAYGCFGRLFDYVYLRRDVEEVVLPEMHSVTPELRRKWLAHSNAHFFRYNDAYDWYDATADFRAASTVGSVHPAVACATPGRPLRFALAPAAGSPAEPVVWSIAPNSAGRIGMDGLYVPPAQSPASHAVRVWASRGPLSAGAMLAFLRACLSPSRRARRATPTMKAA